MTVEVGLRRHKLTQSQAQVFAEIGARKLQVEKEWNLALTLAGLEPSKVVRGDLRPEDPHFLVRDAEFPDE